MLHVFRTDIQDRKEADKILALLMRRLPHSTIKIDLQDERRLLSIEGSPDAQTEVRSIMEIIGVLCEPLPS